MKHLFIWISICLKYIQEYIRLFFINLFMLVWHFDLKHFKSYGYYFLHISYYKEYPYEPEKLISRAKYHEMFNWYEIALLKYFNN